MYEVNEDELLHYGTKRHSGRYPYGSGDRPYQHEPGKWVSEVKRLRGEGLSEKEIADFFGVSMRDFRAMNSVAKTELRALNRSQVADLMAQGYTVAEITRRTGMARTTVTNLIKEVETGKKDQTEATVDVLRDNFKDSDFLDIGKGVPASMGITESRLEAAVQKLKDEGYVEYITYVPQPFVAGADTTVKVLGKPGMTRDDLKEQRDKIGVIGEKFVDAQSVRLQQWEPVQSVSSKRVEVAYSSPKDGVIELRRGVADLDLGNSQYAQVRIGVDDTHYLKGMAVYADDLPAGVDIRFNTNKKAGTPLLSNDPDAKQVLKPMKGSLETPLDAFGTSVKKVNGQRGALNIVYEEGDWSTWSKTIASQVLSKQPEKTARRQLNAARLGREAEYDEIMQLSNPTLRANLLMQFADGCDTAAVNLKAAAVPRQSTNVLLPLTSIAPDKVYAPGFNNGEKVILIRYPHGGTFEIPELTVSNRNKEASSVMKNARDAIGIHPSVAQQLSGADFDGDTVLVIPNNDKAFKTAPQIKSLQEFDAKTAYPRPEGVKKITERHKQREMGEVTNLIADMTIRQAPIGDIIKAVKYSQVVIDAYKHDLDYRQARKDFEINDLKTKWQVHPDGKTGGATTIVTRASSTVRAPEFKEAYKPDPETGKIARTPTGRHYTNKKGDTVYNLTKVEAMRVTDDASTLSSGSRIEAVYVDYANSMKALANRARKEAVNTKAIDYSKTAATQYKDQVTTLKAKVAEAESHSPLVRKSLLLADTEIRMRKAAKPDMSPDELKKVKSDALATARAAVGGGRKVFSITSKEWEAVQAGAISKTLLQDVLKYADADEVKKLAMPREGYAMTPAMLSLARARLNMGYTQAEVAEALGISVSTLNRALNG